MRCICHSSPPFDLEDRGTLKRCTYLSLMSSPLWFHLCARGPLRFVRWEWTCTKYHTSDFPGGKSARLGWSGNFPTAHCYPPSTAGCSLQKTRHKFKRASPAFHQDFPALAFCTDGNSQNSHIFGGHWISAGSRKPGLGEVSWWWVD